MNKTNMLEKKKLVIAGGGTSGWLAAAAFGKLLGKNLDISLIESEEIGRVGVGEATIPPLKTFHTLLGINEQKLMSSVNSTFKLGIEFINWAKKGDNYFHSFGIAGKDCWACDFQHFWLSGLKKGIYEPYTNYSAETLAARNEKMFMGAEGGLNYAYHLDAGLYAEFLKQHAIEHKVKYIEGIIKKVNIRDDNGYIKSLTLMDGTEVEGDLFLDCTGFKGLLIEGALNTSYEHYGHYLPCDSAVAIQTELVRAPRPYTQAIAHDWGWQWRIPLQNRVGNGMVYCSRYVSDDEALSTLLNNIEGKAITEPRAFKYKTGRRSKGWNKNCVAIGLASGFLEPVESTSIHLAMSAILRLLKLFPLDEIQQSNVDEYNKQFREEMDRVRNFVILHYHATQRDDTAFWRYCKAMEIPPELSHRIRLFKETGAVPLQEKELFAVDSWVQVMMGQRILPDKYHPIVDLMDEHELGRFLEHLRLGVEKRVSMMPSHQKFIDQYCKSKVVL